MLPSYTISYGKPYAPLTQDNPLFTPWSPQGRMGPPGSYGSHGTPRFRVYVNVATCEVNPWCVWLANALSSFKSDPIQRNHVRVWLAYILGNVQSDLIQRKCSENRMTLYDIMELNVWDVQLIWWNSQGLIFGWPGFMLEWWDLNKWVDLLLNPYYVLYIKKICLNK